jgi:SAM-dependent methyltransferase
MAGPRAGIGAPSVLSPKVRPTSRYNRSRPVCDQSPRSGHYPDTRDHDGGRAWKGDRLAVRSALRRAPEPIKKVGRPVRDLFRGKYGAELAYWKNRFELEHGHFKNSQYEPMMLAMAGETTDEFLKGKIVADFGSGPRGSLVWARSASIRVGIDVLADRYVDEFGSDMLSHRMVYLKSTERAIPLPTAFVDVMFTLNALDHVNDFSAMCGEILRVLKPSGLFIGSFNLEEPVSTCEPQRLNEGIIDRNLLSRLEVQTRRLTEKGPAGNPYAPFFEGRLSYRPGQEGFLWVRARKPG